MPTNLDALLRYHSIDKCLQNHFRKWTWEDLSKACFECIDEVRYRSEKDGVSKRTIENDIRIMRSSLLGYNAPIVCKSGLYSYSDKNYSIRNATLSQTDIENISLAAKILGHYKGFSFFDGLTGVIQKLETKLQVHSTENLQKVVQFEKFPETKGQEHIRTLLGTITNRQVIELTYKKFDSTEERKHQLHPYLLKEYRNRWYVLGLNVKHSRITTYALDRIIKIELLDGIEYIPNVSFDPEIYFKNTIGLTYSGEDAIDVTLKVVKEFAPYLLTQPLHESQKVISDTGEGLIISVKIVDNEEFQTLLLGYSDRVAVISPESVKLSLIQKLIAAQQKYLSHE